MWHEADGNVSIRLYMLGDKLRSEHIAALDSSEYTHTHSTSIMTCQKLVLTREPICNNALIYQHINRTIY